MAEKQTRHKEHIGLVRNDAYLEPFEDAITGRHEHAACEIKRFTMDGKRSLSDFANGYNYYGLHRDSRVGWVFR